MEVWKEPQMPEIAIIDLAECFVHPQAELAEENRLNVLIQENLAQVVVTNE